MKALDLRRLIEEHGKDGAVTQMIGEPVSNIATCDAIIWHYVLRCLEADNYKAAALVLWGDRLFNPRPKSVTNIWDAISSHPLVMLQGCGGVGKTLTPVIWLLLDYARDPQYTTVKMISATKGHAASNAYSDMVRMHRESCVPLPGEPTSDYIGLDSKEKKTGISVVAIPPGDDGKGRLQGFHPHPRQKTHPTLGDSSRVRAFLDEAITIPVGVWRGVDNMKTSMHGRDAVKVIASYNPSDQTAITAQNAEPINGWDSFDVETGVDGKDYWRSKESWFVLRIDGRKTENVRQKKIVFPGLITYDGYRNLEDKNGGNSVDYYIMARGAFPPEGAIGVVVPMSVWSGAQGEFSFSGSTINVGGVDVAVDGRDNCVLTKGRAGLAYGFQPKRGQFIKFAQERQVLQVDQQFNLKKGSTKIVGDEIMLQAKLLNIAPEYLCVDATGNGSAVHSYLAAMWSEDVLGVDFSKPSTDRKLLEEDKYTCEELYDGIVTEVWFAVSRWMEFCYMAIGPDVRRNPLEKELISRRYVIGAGKRLRVEKKDDYQKRTGSPSPDYADSMTIIGEAARRRASVMGRMVQEKKPEKREKAPTHGIIDTATEWVSV